MVRELARKQSTNFPETAPVANPVFFRTYSRRTEQGRETWEEVRDRCVSGLVKLGQLTREEAQLLEKTMTQLKSLPAGRWLWVGGTQWLENPENYSGAYNCFVGNTLVNTLELGVQPIANLANQKVSVLNRFGQWTPVEFHYHGEQSIMEITLRRGVYSGELTTIQATPEHRWFISHNSQVTDFGETTTATTAQLKAGDYLRFLTAPRPSEQTSEYALGVQHGIVYGDGSIRGTRKRCEQENFKVRLCQAKSELLSYFPEHNINYCPSYNGDALVLIDHSFYTDFVEDGNLKQLPYTANPSYLLGFIRGLLATDGSVSKPNGTPVITINGSSELCQWLTQICPIVGIEAGKTRRLYQKGTSSNYGTRKKDIYELKLYGGSLQKEDFLRQKHKEIFDKGLNQSPVWRVLDVQSLEIKVPVYCCEEPETHGFVLTGGIETGNCTSTNVTDWRAFGLMMDLAMMGCGTGAVLEEKYISQLPTIRNHLQVSVRGEIGTVLPEARQEETTVKITSPQTVTICIGDSRQGWVQSYQALLELASQEDLAKEINVEIDPSHVRPAGERLKGFGGVANPVKIPELYPRLAKILNKAQGRKLNAEECCLLIDEAAATVVAGNIRRCLPEYALVHTARGLVKIKDVAIGDRVQTPLGFRKVVNKFDQGVQDVREIETNGTYPQATENHRMAVLSAANGDYVWKRVSELKSDDRLLHNTQILAGVPTQLPPDETSLRPSQSRNAKGISIPDLNPDVAWLIGFTHGDGYVSLGRNKHNKPYGSIIWATDAEIAPLIEEKLDRALAHFGVSASKQTNDNDNTVRFVCSSIRLTEYFFKNIKRPKEPLEISDFILQGSMETRAAYLAGILDADGSLKNRPPQLVCTVYPQFAYQVASVLSSLGIAGRMGKTIPKQLNWQTKYHVNIPAFKAEYNKLIAPHSVKGELKLGLKMYGFTLTGEMMREAYTYSEMQSMGFQGKRTVASNYERYRVESELEIDVPVTFKQLGQVFAVQTYDIEVEDAHCFYCDGYLTHNSAGIRQFDSTSPLLKQNLWQPDENGNWHIDPERDALRMANHTRVYHHKPSLEDCVEAVRSQFYSGEGAIQYAPEAIARGNADLLSNFELKQQFIQAYEQGNGETFLRQCTSTPIGEQEMQHRMERYGLNPCVTGDTWVHTENGAQQVKDLIGKQHSVYVNGELFSTTPEGFFYTGTKSVVKLTTEEGYTLRLTPNHQVLKVTAQTQKKQYTEWVAVEDLEPRDRVMLHNHRDIRPWEGKGTFEEGWEMSVSGDPATSSKIPQKNQSKGIKQEETVQLLERSQTQLLSNQVEEGSYEFYQGFLAGLFSAFGSVEDTTEGVRVKLSPVENPVTVQRMLLRLGVATTCLDKELVITGDNLHRFQAIIGFRAIEKGGLMANALEKTFRNLSEETFTATVKSIEPDGIEAVYDCTVPGVHRFDANGLVAHNCGEIIGSSFHCNLSEIHLNLIDPDNEEEQAEAFQAGALSVAALLNHEFVEPRYQYSRELDPIVGVSFTGLFDFFVQAFGVEWLRWWEEGRPNTPQGKNFKEQEKAYLEKWREIVHKTVWDYCDRHNIKRPNRCTTVQPSGTKSLLTGASPGWHPPKAVRFIRRVTFGKNDPVARACLDYGYNVIPSQSDKDENGNLLHDPFDPRCTEWLVEIPVAVPWADLEGADNIDISKFSVLAQFDFAMQVQKHYVTHNTSATLELREPEIEDLGKAIYQAIQNDEGYISAALLARFDAYQTFPRLPFEPIDEVTYNRLMGEVKRRQKTDDFYAALMQYDDGEQAEAGPAGCDSDQCMFPESFD